MLGFSIDFLKYASPAFLAYNYVFHLDIFFFCFLSCRTHTGVHADVACCICGGVFNFNCFILIGHTQEYMRVWRAASARVADTVGIQKWMQENSVMTEITLMVTDAAPRV